MARHESENVDSLNLPDPNILKTTYFLETGEISDDQTLKEIIFKYNAQRKRLPVVCAKQNYNTNTKMYSYYIMCAGSQMFDTTNIDVRYRTRNNWKYIKVKRTTFQLYTKFLKTKYKTYLHHAERNI